MRLYDTATRGLVELPQPGERPIGMYFCGPTVYQRIHVGNARPFVVSMWLRRWLTERGHDVTLVENITDINDKIYAAAPGDSARLAADAARWYVEDTDLLGVGRPDHEPLATGTIPEIVSLIEELVERDRIMKVINLTHRELQRWGIERPRLAVAALNPHGAEGGLFGVEEASEIMPAIESARQLDDINVQGPFSADTVFLRASRGEFDAVVACYHDQAMIPVKCLSFGEAVNVTLGLPFIRTSVDHGTAFDIAGKGVAEHSSMVAAIKLAAELSTQAGESCRAVEV